MPDNKQNAILTLDAGGTSFVFSAIVDNKEAVEPICSEAFPADLKKCLDSMVVSFKKVIDRLNSNQFCVSGSSRLREWYYR